MKMWLVVIVMGAGMLNVPDADLSIARIAMNVTVAGV